MPYMLDTDICIYTIKKRPAHVIERVQGLDPNDVAISKWRSRIKACPVRL